MHRIGTVSYTHLDVYKRQGVVTGLYKKELLLKSGVKFPDKILYEDNYWVAILMLYVKRYFHLAEDMYHYRQREDSTVHKKNAMHHVDLSIIHI